MRPIEIILTALVWLAVLVVFICNVRSAKLAEDKRKVLCERKDDPASDSVRFADRHRVRGPGLD
jgi:hypothetical protein